MFTRRNCDVHSCVAHTQLYHTQWVERTATPRLRGESRHLQWWAEIKALLWGLPLAWSKGPGCCSLCRYGATVLLFFLAVSLRDRGSKLVTVSFRLQSRAFSSCWGEGGGDSLLWRGRTPHLPFWWFTDSREPQGHWLKLSFSTHLFQYESVVLNLTRSLCPYLSAPSQMFHICFYKWFCKEDPLSQWSWRECD